MSENPYDLMSELAKAKFIPPDVPWSARKKEIYPKFEYFAKMTAQYTTDPQARGLLADIEQKLK